MKSKNLSGVAEASIEVVFQIVDKSKYKTLIRIAASSVQKLSKERGFSRAGASDNELFTAFGCKDTVDCVAEFSFYVWLQNVVLHYAT